MDAWFAIKNYGKKEENGQVIEMYSSLVNLNDTEIERDSHGQCFSDCSSTRSSVDPNNYYLIVRGPLERVDYASWLDTTTIKSCDDSAKDACCGCGGGRVEPTAECLSDYSWYSIGGFNCNHFTSFP